MMNQILDVNSDWIDGEPTLEGQKFRIKIDGGNGNFGYEETVYSLSQAVKPQVALTNIAITKAALNGAIYWMSINTPFVLTANVQLPNSQMMVMIEQVVRDDRGVYQVVSDVRVIANIVDGVVTIKAQFEKSGNYRIKAERLNLGLDEIGAPFNLSFDLIEFDAYEETI